MKKLEDMERNERRETLDAFALSDLGKLFYRYRTATQTAWIRDTESSLTDNISYSKLEKLWDTQQTAEVEFINALRLVEDDFRMRKEQQETVDQEHSDE